MTAILPFETRSSRKRLPITRLGGFIFIVILLYIKLRSPFSRPLQQQSNQSTYSLATEPRPFDFHEKNDYAKENARVADVASSAPPKAYRPAPPPEISTAPPIIDNFPLAMHAQSPEDLPPIPAWNIPPSQHVNVTTPLFIGFTRGWRMLQQVVLSYITAGWPPSDIYVVDNTGTMNANRLGRLSLQNPFFLNTTRLTNIYGINVVSTPTLLTFAQMQNFFTNYAVEHDWPHYFWAHMDTVALSDEEFDFTDSPFKSLYLRAVDAVREAYEVDKETWGMRWFQYDYLTLVRTGGNLQVGGWDTMIPFYQTDCDMHERVWMSGLSIWDVYAGKVMDTNRAFDDLRVLFYRDGDQPLNTRTNASEEQMYVAGSVTGNEDPEVKSASAWRPDPETETSNDAHLKGPHYRALIKTLEYWAMKKGGSLAYRNQWQRAQHGGQGDPFYRDEDGFQRALDRWIDIGWHDMWMDKWGIADCAAREAGLDLKDAWVVERDWREKDVQMKLEMGEVRGEREAFGVNGGGRAKVADEEEGKRRKTKKRRKGKGETQA